MREKNKRTSKNIAKKIDWERLLQHVGRSFAVTLPLLPRPMRRLLVLAYLLARTSDTLVDEGKTSLKEREQWMELLSELQQKLVEQHPWEELKKSLAKPLALMLRDGYRACTLSNTSDFVTRKKKKKSHQESKTAEQQLLMAFPSLLEELATFAPQLQLLTYELWGEILAGQRSDLLRQQEGGNILSREERERYLYQVAGSVGRYWSEVAVALLKEPAPFTESLATMRDWGIAYGKGLQLLNILRDREEDLTKGYHYYHEEEYLELWEETNRYLEAGRRYCHAIRNRKLRQASLVPLLLAKKLLPRLRERAAFQKGKKVKLRHWEVWEVVLKVFFTG